jgi:hemerythrin-like domain-containing protein
MVRRKRLSESSPMPPPLDCLGKRHMKPIGLLMREHRLIEKYIKQIETELKKSKKTHAHHSDFLLSNIDFFQMYADRTHHGKEEDILFRELKKKNISSTFASMVERLIDDHRYARAIIVDLSNQINKYLAGETRLFSEINKNFEKLITLYPVHIETEDKEFFYPSMDYFSEEEQQHMLQEFYDFDKKMIHEKYVIILEQLEKQM